MLGGMAIIAYFITGHEDFQLSLLHTERPKLHTNLAFLSAVGLK